MRLAPDIPLVLPAQPPQRLKRFEQFYETFVCPLHNSSSMPSLTALVAMAQANILNML